MQNNHQINEMMQLAKSFLQNKDFQNAAVILNDILKLQPNNIEALENIGIIFAQTNNCETAEKIFKQLISISPEASNLYNNLSNVQDSLGKKSEAFDNIKKAIKIKPDSIDYLMNFYRLLVLEKNYDEAYETLKKIHNLDNKNTLVLENLYNLAASQDPENMIAFMKKLNEVATKASLELAIETSLPFHFQSQEEIDNFRLKYLSKLDNILDKDIGKIDVSEKIFQNIFYFAYHNANNKLIKQKLAKVYSSKIDNINFVAPHCSGYKFDKENKIKIGFISSFFHNHPVAKCFNGIIEKLSQDDKFEVNIYYFVPASQMADSAKDEYIQRLKNCNIKFNTIPESLVFVREVISQSALDVLVYLDIGMHWLSYQLAFARLAPIQILMPGHPDTTGIETIDYYFSAKDLEAENGQDFYSEKLVIFDNIPTYIEKPKMPDALKSRKELGLPEDKKIYYCPMKNQKFHPDFDFAIKKILENDKNALIMVPKDTGKISDLTNARIEKNIGKNLTSRIFYHEWASNQEFISYLKTADVVLDTFYFGAGTTVYYALSADAPMVTLPGNTTGGRVLNAVYKRIDLQELIATDQNDYINKAIKIANDLEFKNTISKKIKSRKEVLFNNDLFLPELKGFILEKLEKTTS